MIQRAPGGSGSSPAEFFRFEDDEVLVDGLQGGVGHAGGAVEDGPAGEDHVKPLEQRAAGEAVEEGFLVEAAGVEVWAGQSGLQGGILQSPIANDQLGFHSGVEVVLCDPVSDALGEGKVIERVA